MVHRNRCVTGSLLRGSPQKDANRHRSRSNWRRGYAGAHGGGTGEEGDQGRTIALKAELDAAVKKGDARAALEACIKLQPKAVANLYGMTR